MRSGPGLIKLASGRQRSYRLFSCGERQETNVQGGQQATNWNHTAGMSEKGYHHPGYVLLVVGPRTLPRVVKLKGVHLILMIYKPDTILLICRREYILPKARMLVLASRVLLVSFLLLFLTLPLGALTLSCGFNGHPHPDSTISLSSPHLSFVLQTHRSSCPMDTPTWLPCSPQVQCVQIGFVT